MIRGGHRNCGGDGPLWTTTSSPTREPAAQVVIPARLIVTNPILTPFDETVPLALCLSIVPDATPRREVVYFGSHGLQSRRPTT